MNRCCLVGGLLAVALVLTQSGCRGKNSPVPVEGIVTLDGAAVEGATVLFVPEAEGGRPASGRTDDDGVFQLATFAPEDGALPGNYRVVVTKSRGRSAPRDTLPGEDKQAVEHYQQRVDVQKRPKSLLPALYGAESTTILRCQVPADGRVTLALKSKP